jgi:hypothetical protein
VYRWGRTEPSLFSTPVDLTTGFGLGGGGNAGGYGLWVDTQLAFGTSEPCATFQNPTPLNGGSSFNNGNGRFGLSEVEVWALGDHSAEQLQRNESAGRPKPKFGA